MVSSSCSGHCRFSPGSPAQRLQPAEDIPWAGQVQCLRGDIHLQVLQGPDHMFPGTECWPFPRYQCSCGRLMVWASSWPLQGLYCSMGDIHQRIDVAYQLLHITQGLGHNSQGFLLYYTRLDEDMFGLLDDQSVFITDDRSIGVIDLNKGFPPDSLSHSASGQDIFSCLGQGTSSYQRTPPCSAIRPTQSLSLLCAVLLSRLLLTSRDKGAKPTVLQLAL
ncbi:hypothetical protein UPYG_G00156630 [Umbra pygmaea]|uniref:FAM69 protein-kinase domain-containing protein n=1 Tax=Umbra pygmaea TaxID=75934 RepID=A0ABD0XGF2_UMBPY